MSVLLRLRILCRRRYSVEAEMVIAALVLIGWELGRLPLEGRAGLSVRHARSWLRLEDALGIDVERPLIDFGSRQPWNRFLDWAYGGLHTPAMFAFLAAACLLAPDRYPRLRTIFVLSFLPALVVIGMYPLAPPHWLPELGLGPTPTQHELTGTLTGIFQNSTAAAASQHFGFAAFIAAGIDMALSSLPPCLGDVGLPGDRVRRNRGHGEPLRARLRRRRPDVLLGSGGRPARPPRPDSGVGGRAGAAPTDDRRCRRRVRIDRGRNRLPRFTRGGWLELHAGGDAARRWSRCSALAAADGPAACHCAGLTRGHRARGVGSDLARSSRCKRQALMPLGHGRSRWPLG